MLDRRLTEATDGVREALSGLVPPPVADHAGAPNSRTPLQSGSSPVWRGPLIAVGTAVAIMAVVGVSLLLIRGGTSFDSADETTPTTMSADATVATTVASSTPTTETPTTVSEPTAGVTPLVDEQGMVLATTKANQLPTQATCPPGSDPDVPGPFDQERPRNMDGAQAFDRHAGRIVVLANDEQPKPRTWTFDVCSNTWQRMDPPEEPRWDDPVTLVYDADSDRTIAFARDRVWSYDFSADRWTREGVLPRAVKLIAGWGTGDRAAAVYHPPSGLVIVYDADMMWAYDVETDTWTEVLQVPDPSRPAGSDLPDGATGIAYDRDRDLLLAAVAVPDGFADDTGLPSEAKYRSWLADGVLEIWAFDPTIGSWRLAPSQVPARVLWSRDGWFYGPVHRAAFDEASGVTVYLSAGGWVEAYDGRRNWRAFPGDAASGAVPGSRCDSVDPVYDPLHGRIVCQVYGGGVSSFATDTGTWSWLVKPDR